MSPPNTGQRAATVGQVQSTLNYLVPGRAQPITYMYARPSGASIRTGEYRPYTVFIRDGRASNDEFSLDAQGFVLRRHATTVSDFYNDSEVRAQYYAEIEQLVREETGAVRAFMFDHTLRSVAWSERSVREPVRIVHNDYTSASGPQRVRDLLDATEMKYRDRSGETYSVSHNPEHRWSYFSQMTRDEVLLFKCYDSAEDGRARYGAHSAFDFPTPTSAIPTRESVEAG